MKHPFGLSDRLSWQLVLPALVNLVIPVPLVPELDQASKMTANPARTSNSAGSNSHLALSAPSKAVDKLKLSVADSNINSILGDRVKRFIKIVPEAEAHRNVLGVFPIPATSILLRQASHIYQSA
jgi:hypothetical protein